MSQESSDPETEEMTYSSDEERMGASLFEIDWCKFDALQTALCIVENADQTKRKSVPYIRTVLDEVKDFLNTMGIVVQKGCNEFDELELTWENVNPSFFVLAYDLLHTVHSWYKTTVGGSWTWLCYFLCPLDVNRKHLRMICDFLVGCGLKVVYWGTEGRVIPRITLYISVSAWDFRDDNFRPINCLSSQTEMAEP